VPFTQYSGVIAFAGCTAPLFRFQLVSWVCAFEPTFPTALATNSEQHQEAGFLHLVSFRKLELVEQDGVSGRYRLGPFALRLGLACFRG
jgi:DNA-binding IclR family transcriptional regulator